MLKILLGEVCRGRSTVHGIGEMYPPNAANLASNPGIYREASALPLDPPAGNGQWLILEKNDGSGTAFSPVTLCEAQS
jgi:hypothetical protein